MMNHLLEMSGSERERGEKRAIRKYYAKNALRRNVLERVSNWLIFTSQPPTRFPDLENRTMNILDINYNKI